MAAGVFDGGRFREAERGRKVAEVKATEHQHYDLWVVAVVSEGGSRPSQPAQRGRVWRGRGKNAMIRY